jgi:hypothetical protein
MKNLATNWKTTSAGLGMILTGLSGLLHFVNPEVPGPDLSTSLASLIGGIGLLFAKDGNVSGGSVRQ